MNCIQYGGVASSLLGMVGTATLFFSSYSLQPLEGAVLGGPETAKTNDDIRRKNVRRLCWQKMGLICLLLSFIVQGAMIPGWFC